MKRMPTATATSNRHRPSSGVTGANTTGQKPTQNQNVLGGITNRRNLMLKRLTILLVALCGLALSSSAAATNHYGAWGWALEDTGARCGSDCTAYFQVNHYGSTNYMTTFGAVGLSGHNCGTLDYNFGRPPDLLHCYIVNGNFHFDLGSQLFETWQAAVWIRHGCPSGYYYSPVHTEQWTYQSVNDDHTFWAGTLRLGSHTSCYPNILTDAGMVAAFVGN